MPGFTGFIHRKRVPSDLLWALLSATLDAVSALGSSGTIFRPTTQSGLWSLGLVAGSLAIASLISVHRATYLRWRTGFLVAVKLLGFLATSAPVRQHRLLFTRHLLSEGGPPASTLLRLAVVSEEGLLLFLGAVGWCLPWPAYLYVQAAGLLCVLSALPAECSARCAHHDFAAMYADWTEWLSWACGRIFPFTVAARRDRLFPHPCIVVHAWANLVLGFVLPALYIQWMQCHLRQLYERETGQGQARMPSEPCMRTWVHCGMAAVALPVTWRAVEVVMSFWHLLRL